MIMYPPYLWLPSIIGSNESKTFLVSAISTLVTKMVILGIALLYAFMGVQQWINPRPFLLWCEEQWDEEERTKNNITLCFNFTSCFDNFGDIGAEDKGLQKLRVCTPEAQATEATMWICVFVALFVSNSLSFAAAVWLNRIADYTNMFEATRTFLWVFKTEPVVHRSAIVASVRSEKQEDHDRLKEMLEAVENKTEMVNRPNSDGNSPLLIACGNISPTPLALLIENEADVNQLNSDEDSPLHIAVKNDSAEVAALLIKKGAKVNQYNNDGDTPLHVACRDNQIGSCPDQEWGQVSAQQGQGDASSCGPLEYVDQLRRGGERTHVHRDDAGASDL